jgi:hypothetical protein
LEQRLAILSVRGQRIDSSACEPTVSVATIQLYLCGVKEVLDNIKASEHGCVPIKFYLQNR